MGNLRLASLLPLGFAVTGCLAGQTAPADFREHILATGLKGGYQVVAADLNKDGKPDLIALASGMKELVWFENPSWQRHVIIGNQNRMINLAAWDVDSSRIPAIVLASEFANQAKNSIGMVSLLRHNGDPREPWSVTTIDRLPTSHRLRWADIEGKGEKVLVNAPLTGTSAEAPDYRGKTPLVFYRPGEWKRQLIGEENEGVTHGISCVDWDGDGRDAILTASFVGLHLYRLGARGWTRTQISGGDPAPWPKSGSSDVSVGRGFGKKEKYLAAIEPWHGNQVAIYRAERGEWTRTVIDASLEQGHTILTADLNGDGVDEIVAGYRGTSHGVNVYYAEKQGGWEKRKLDGGDMAASACAAADLNADGRIDIACIGSATANLKWYENLGRTRERP